MKLQNQYTIFCLSVISIQVMINVILLSNPNTKQNENNITPADIANAITNNTNANAKASTSTLNATTTTEYCPSFLTSLPGCDVDIWRYMKEIGFKVGNCDQRNCSNCIPPNSSNPDLNKIHDQWFGMYSHTKQARFDSISQLLRSRTRTIIVMVLNTGYAYLFRNWVCSLDYHDLAYIREHTLVMPSTTEAVRIVNESGFRLIHDPYRWMPPDIHQSFKFNHSSKTKASLQFLEGGHLDLVALQMMALADLIELGYNVLMLDSDIIWRRDVLQYVNRELFGAKPEIDIWTSIAPRWDMKGFGNTGTIFMQSNCRTKAMMRQIMTYISTIFCISDQATFNFWLNWKPFREVSFRVLNQHLFIGGGMGDGKIVPFKTKVSDLVERDFYLVHAYATSDHFMKIVKFHQVDQWYFTADRCPHLFDAQLLPRIQDRMQNKQSSPSSTYLIKHKLIRT